MESTFDRRARAWDNDYRIGRARLIAEEIARRVPLSRVHRAMEFGCGTGLVGFELLDRLRDVTFVDRSSEMLSILGEKVRAASAESRCVLSDDLFSAEHEEGSLDLIYASMSLHHVPAIEATARRFRDLLRAGGTLCVVDLTEDDGSYHRDEADFDGYDGFDPRRLSNELAGYGFAEHHRSVFFSDTRAMGGRSVNYSLFILTMERVNKVGC